VSRTRHARTPKTKRAPRTGKVAIPYKTALTLSQYLGKAINAAAGSQLRMFVAGSLRRKKAMVGDVDLVLVDPADAAWAALATVRGLTLDAYGPMKASGWFKSHGKRIRVDLRRTTADSLGAALEYFTGPAGHNLGMRMKARKAGYKLNEYGLFRLSDGAKAAGATEASIYDVLKHAWKPPEERGR